MIYIVFIVGVQILVVYSCIATSTPYDQTINDNEQETFLQQYNR